MLAPAGALSRRAIIIGGAGLALIVVLGLARAVSERSRAALDLTDEEQAWLEAHRDAIPLYFNPDFPPIEFASPEGEFVGLGADVIARVEERLGVRFVKRPCVDWNRHLAALESGECAIAPTIVRTPERERYARFTAPYATVPVVIIAPHDAGHDLDLEHLAGKRVAVVSGFATEDYVRERSGDAFEVVPVKTVPEGLRAAAFGHADFLVENLAVAAYYIERDGYPNLHVCGETDYSFAWSIGVSREHPLLYSSIEKALGSLSESEMASLRRRWISLDAGPRLSPEAVLLLKLSGLFLAALLLGLMAVSVVLKRRLNEKVARLAESQREVTEQTERLRLAMDATNAAIWDLRPATGEVYFSEQWRTMLGYANGADAPASPDLSEYMHPDDLPAANAALAACLAPHGRSELEVEFRLRHADGSWKWILGRGTVIGRDADGRPTRILGLNVDIQQRKEVQDALLASERTFRQAIEAMPLGCVIAEPGGDVRHVNRAFTRMLGYALEDIEGYEDWWRLAYPDEAYRRRVREEWERDTLLERDPRGAAEPNAYNVAAKDGTTRTLQFSAAALGDRVLILLDDVTERRLVEAERERLQTQLAQAQKMESVGRLAGGVAHDFNNMLGVILGHAELALGRLGREHPVVSDLEQIQRAAERSADLTRQLLAFARRQAVTPQVLDLNGAIERSLRMLKRLIGEHIRLEWIPGHGVGPVRMDPSQLDQILANLCVNSRDAIADVGTIVIETSMTDLDEAYCASHPDVPPGAYSVLAVSDTGHGMAPEVLAHVFEPFFTTKGVGEGTGLGLATTYGIVKQNGGTVAAYSEPGSGTTIRIYLPACAEGAAPEAKPAPALEPEVGHETVLLVEDEPGILAMARQMLEQLGYDVAAAATPGEAIALAKEPGRRVDLLMTDVVMPQMSGPDLAERVLAVHPDAKCLFMSGYAETMVVRQGMLDEDTGFLQKPFRLSDLATALREALAPR